MSILTDLRSNRMVKFLIVHAIVAAVAAVYVLNKHAHVPGPALFPYLLAMIEVFFGSFAGALLSLVQLVNGLMRGFSNAGGLVLMGHVIPLPVVAGIAAIGAAILKIAGIRMYRSKMGYVVMLLASLLFLTSAYVYFIDMGGNARATLELAMSLQPEK